MFIFYVYSLGRSAHLHWKFVFSPLGKLADRAIYFTFRNFFFLTLAKLSHDLLDRFSRSLHQMKGICVNFLDPDLIFYSFRDVAIAPILGKNCEMTFIQHAGISQRIRISQFHF